MSAYLTLIQMRVCSMLLVSSAFAMCVFSSGCSTIGDDISDFTSDFVATTPFEAAEMMIDRAKIRHLKTS